MRTKGFKLLFVYFFIVINIILLKIFSGITFFFLRANKKKKLIVEDQKKKDIDLLINYDLGLGDNTIILESLFELDILYKKLNKKLIMVAQKEYKLFYEMFSFKNIDFFYVESNIKKMKNSLNGFFQLIKTYKKNKKILRLLNADNVFFTRNDLYIDDLIFLSTFKYKNAYKFYNSYLYANNLEKDADKQKCYLFFPYLLKYFSLDEFNIKIFNDKLWWEKNRKDLICELVYFVNGEKYLTSKNTNQVKSEVKKQKFKICVNPFSTIYYKNVNLDFLLKILESLNKLETIEVDFYGSSEKEVLALKDKTKDLNFKNNIFWNLNITEYFQVIKNYDFVVSNDSATFHIGNYWGKKTLCFYNASSKTYLNNFNYWSNKNKENNLFAILSADYFEKITEKEKKSIEKISIIGDKKFNIFEDTKIIDYICKTLYEFMINKSKKNIVINEGMIF